MRISDWSSDVCSSDLYAADLRAPTPTAAAELAVPVRADLSASLTTLGLRAERCARRYVERGRERLEALARLLPKRDALLGPQRQKVDELAARLDRGLEHRLTRALGQLDRTTGALRQDERGSGTEGARTCKSRGGP